MLQSTLHVLLGDFRVASSSVEVVADTASCGQTHDCDSSSRHIGSSRWTIMVERRVLGRESFNCGWRFCLGFERVIQDLMRGPASQNDVRVS